MSRLLEGEEDLALGATESLEDEREAQRVAEIRRLQRIARRNVILALLTTFIIYTSQGVWGYAVLGPYIENLTDSNSKVGYAEGIQGIFKAVLALPAGYVADRWSRSGVIRIGTLLAGVAATLTIVSLFTSESDSQQYLTLTIALAAWGAFEGAIVSPIQALFADSNPLGKRDVAFMRLFAAQIVGNAAGPIVNAVLFTKLGNEWTQSQLRLVFTVGIIVGAPGYVLISCFQDLKKKGRGEGRQELQGDQEDAPLSIQDGVVSDVVTASDIAALEQEGTQGDMNSLQVPLILSQQASESEQKWPVYAEDLEQTEALDQSHAAEEDPDEDGEHMLYHRAHPDIQEGGRGAVLFGRHWKWLTVDKIPLITAIGDIAFGIASGMTIKFFPLFFKNRCDMRPVTVNVIYILMPVFLVIATYLAQKWSVSAGRAQVSVYTHFMGVAFLVLMVALKDYWKEPWIIIPVYLIRTATINCGYPLVKSILMDSVTSKQRAKWNSLESVSAFGWSGSAALGGLLLDHSNYEVTFIVTAIAQFLATIWTMLLLPLVPVKQYVPEDEELRGDEGGDGGFELRRYSHQVSSEALFYHDDSDTDVAIPL